MVKHFVFHIYRQAWQKLGAMPPEEAMQKYIDIVTELFPTWIAGSSVVRSLAFRFMILLVSVVLLLICLIYLGFFEFT